MLFWFLGFIFLIIFSLEDTSEKELERDKKDFKRITGHDYK